MSTSYNYAVPFSASVEWSTTLKAPNGSENLYGSGVENQSTTLYHSKTSNDEGAFIPGQYRVNPYSVSKEVITAPVVNREVSYFDGYWTYVAKQSGAMPAMIAQLARSTLVFPPLKVPANLPQEALIAAYGKLATNSVGGGEILGELRETIDLLRHPFNGLSDFLLNYNRYNLGLLNKLTHYLKTGKWLGDVSLVGQDAAKAAAGTWLEFRYGFMPLVYTTQDIIEVVNRKVIAFDSSKIRCARAKISSEKNLSYRGTAGLANMQIYAIATGCDRYTCFASVQYRQAFEHGIAEILGLTPRFIPEIAWELTKLSWVVDWWWGVGDWLAALRQKPGITILGNTVGSKLERQVAFLHEGRYAVPTAPMRPFGSLGTYHKQSYSRDIQLHLPVIPLLDADYHSYIHAIDAVSLILQKSLSLLAKSR